MLLAFPDVLQLTARRAKPELAQASPCMCLRKINVPRLNIRINEALATEEI
jgi:hypothetical protein